MKGALEMWDFGMVEYVILWGLDGSKPTERIEWVSGIYYDTKGEHEGFTGLEKKL